MSWISDLDLSQTLLDSSPHAEMVTHGTLDGDSQQASLTTITPVDMSLHPFESFAHEENWISGDAGIDTNGWTPIAANPPENSNHLSPVFNDSASPWPTTGYDGYTMQHAGLCVPYPPLPMAPTYANHGLLPQDNFGMLRYISSMLEY